MATKDTTPSRTRWTQRELTYLTNHIADRAWEQLAAHLGRSETAVRLKAKRLGLAKSAPGYTRQALAAALGVHPSRIDTWRTRGWLHGQRRQTSRTERQGDLWRFERADVRAFLRAGHFNEIDFAKVDPKAFLEIAMDMELSSSAEDEE